MENKYVLCKREELECLRIKAKDLLEELDAVLASAPQLLKVKSAPVKSLDDAEVAAMLARFFIEATRIAEKKD